MMAVELEYVQWVELLMEHGANINQQNHIGTTALLLLASHQSHSNVVRTLIAINAKINEIMCILNLPHDDQPQGHQQRRVFCSRDRYRA